MLPNRQLSYRKRRKRKNLLSGATVDIVSEENGWYEIVVPEQSGYVCGEYLDVVKNPVEETKSAPTESDTEKNKGLTPDGNLTMVDDIGSASGEGRLH